MTKENFEKYDKSENVYCECCKQYKPVSSFNYRNIKTNTRNANRCRACDWIYRNHNGKVPEINGFTDYDITKTISFIFDNDIPVINTLSNFLNKTIDDIIDLIYKLNLKNIPIRIQSNCSCCGKEIEEKISVYLKRKYPYCSHECY